MAQAKFLSKDVSNEGLVILKLGNGWKFEVNPKDYPSEIQEDLLIHGAKQKLGDATAGFSKTNDYGGAKDAILGVHESLMAGVWNREAGGFGVSIDDLAQAIAALKKTSVEKAKAAVEAAPTEKRKEWASNKKVAALIAEYRAARAKENAKQEKDELDIQL